MPIAIQEHSFDTGTVTLNYAEGPPSGPPLLLLHGGSARWQSFQSIIPDLAGHSHLYALDLRGHGKSGRVAGAYRLQDYVDDTAAFLEQCLEAPAALFGHSLGGMVALMVAAQRPDHVRAVIVGDSPLTGETWGAVINDGRDRLAVWRDLAGGQRSVEEVAEALKLTTIRVPVREKPVPMREAMGDDWPVFDWLAANLYQNDPAMLIALLEDFESVATGYDMEVVLPAIHCPVLLLQADPASGGLMTDTEIERALPLFGGISQVVRLKGISHVLHNQQKEPVLEALKQFLY